MTGDAIEKVLYDIMKSFNNEYLHIGGAVYYRGLRPIQKTITDYKEDAEVSFLSGSGGDVLSGTCIVNVFVPDIVAPSGMYYENITRCREIGDLLMTFPKYANKTQGDLYFKRVDMIVTLAEESIKQHFVSLKLDFKVLNQYY